jgi:hypothetical protein
MLTYPSQETPFVVGLFGDWGEGKSSVLRQLETHKSLKARRFVFRRFSAWEYEHCDSVAAAIAREAVHALRKGTWVFGRAWVALRFAFARYRGTLAAATLSFLAWIAFAGALGYLGWILSDPIQRVFSWGAGSAAFAAALAFNARRLRDAFTDAPFLRLARHVTLPDYGEHLGQLTFLKESVQSLCKLSGVTGSENSRRLIFAVDDLDRCAPESIVAIFDAVRIVMGVPGVVTIIAVDGEVAVQAVATHFRGRDVLDRPLDDLARDYLGKIINLPFWLGTMQRRDRDRYIEEGLMQQRTHDGALVHNVSGKGVRGGARGSAAKKNAMTEHDAEVKYFQKIAADTGITNARKLRRLRNTYRVLKRLRPVLVDGLRFKEYYVSSWYPMMVQLFWEEFLHTVPLDLREACKTYLWSKEDPLVFKRTGNTDRLQSQAFRAAWSTRARLLSLFGYGRAEHDRIAMHVQRHIFPREVLSYRTKPEDMGESESDTGPTSPSPST